MVTLYYISIVVGMMFLGVPWYLTALTIFLVRVEIRVL